MKYDIIVIGGGHAGIEACNICSKLGKKTLLITEKINEIGKLSCNPSIGGVGKSQIVKEIDILGGVMGKIADKSCRFIKVLNTSKGLASRSTRIQVDKYLYSKISLKFLSEKKNLFILQEKLIDICIKNNSINYVVTENFKISCSCLIITTGTFLGYKILKKNKKRNNLSLYKKMKNIFQGISKFKTGTPPRVDEKTIDYENIKFENSDKNKYLSFFGKKRYPIFKSYITSTSLKTREIVLKNINKSYVYKKKLFTKGPRYCPSFEDKIFKYSNKKHNIFLEKESKYSSEVYLNGLSNSFDFKTQQKIVNSIKGLEKSFIMSYAFSIEYYFFNPFFLKNNLETKIDNIFFAGQINGTTGYEEAACQGLYAGINACFKIDNKKPFILSEKKSYIGLLIKDITSDNIKEPYRMFLNRSKYRLNLREDNVINRLSKKSYKNKLINKKKYIIFKKIIDRENEIIEFCKKKKYKKKYIYEIIKNTKISIKYFYNNNFFSFKFLNNFFDFVDSEIKYSEYLKRSEKENIKIKKNFILPKNFKIFDLKFLPKEILEKSKGMIFKNFHDFYKIPHIKHTTMLSIMYFFRR
ncbi:FAD-dependent oxidoreductase [Candidatus Vidania fulgoroideorum]